MTIEERVRAILSATNEHWGASPDLTNLPSLDVIEIIFNLEEEFKLNIPDDAAQQFKTVGDVIAYLQDREEDRSLGA